MKIFYVLGTILILIIGGYILFHSVSDVPVQSIASELTAPTQSPSPVPPSVTPTKANQKTQVIEATYGPPFGFYPTEFTIKAGTPARLEVTATENGRGCMGSIMLPELLPGNIQGFIKGETDIFEFTPATPGTYQITCAMGIPHATITVN